MAMQIHNRNHQQQILFVTMDKFFKLLCSLFLFFKKDPPTNGDNPTEEHDPTTDNDSNKPEKSNITTDDDSNQPKQPNTIHGGRVTTQPSCTPLKEPKNYQFICRKTQEKWQIYIQIPDSKIKVLQNGEELSMFRKHQYQFQLKNFSDAVCWDDNEKLLFDEKPPIIFRLRRNNAKEGRQVRFVSKTGNYIVFAPCAWKRINKRCTPPEECADNSFEAHYFPTEGEDGFEECKSFIIDDDRFWMDGQKIDDNSDKGDLFGGNVLELKDKKEWKNITCIRVGEEGGGTWGKNYRPKEKNLSDVLNGRAGWFYIRIYDENVKLLDSWDFRYLPKLKNILINNHPYSPEIPIIPAVSGHTATRIRFVDIEENNISAKLREENPHVTVQDDGSIDVKPHPSGDFTKWALTINSKSVEIDIALPRVWWRIGETNDWGDKPLTMTREEFYERREESVEIYVPFNVKNIRAGFDGSMEKSFQTKRCDSRINYAKSNFSLRNFADHPKIDPSFSTKTELQIKCGIEIFTLINIPKNYTPPPEPPPPEFSIVPTSWGWRRGKGFSIAELSEAGLTTEQARKRKISIDKRRKSKYNDNITKLRSINNNAR